MALCAALIAGCSQAPKVERHNFPIPKNAEVSKSKPGEYGGIFVLSDATEPKTFNFLVPGDASSGSAQSKFLSSLTSYDPFTQEQIPALATAWEIAEDKKTYTFHLREGIKWSDGKPFSADDVIFTFDCIFAVEIDPSTGNPIIDDETKQPKPRYPNRYIDQYTIGGEPIQYRKTGPFTIEFTTKELYSPFINDIGFVPIVPKHILDEAYLDGSLQEQWSAQTAIENPGKLIGTGPFKVYSYRPGERIVYEPNPHYWRVDSKGQRLPYINYLVDKFVQDQNTETVLFATGQVDASSIAATDVTWVSKAAKTYDFTVYDRGPSTSISMIWFNQNTGKDEHGKSYLPVYKQAWFNNKIFRQAIFYGFDREGIAKGVYFERAEPLDSVISQGNTKWYNKKIKKYRYNPDKARALLLKEGFNYQPDGQLVDKSSNLVEFDLMIFEGSARVAEIATTFQQNMAGLGINIKITYVDFGVILQKTNYTFDYDLAIIGWGSSAGASDPSGSKALFLSSGIYHLWHPRQKKPATAWEAKIDKLLVRQERTFNEKERIAIFNQIQDIFAEQVPLVFLLTPFTYSGIQNKWQNVQVPPSGTILWNMDELWTKRL